MRRARKVLVVLLAAIGGIATSLVVLAFLRVNGYFGHSDYFEMLDTNSDDTLSYKEWMTSYSLLGLERPIEKSPRRDFYHSDCNQDDVLTWREYYDFRFRRKECASAAVPTLAQLYVSTPESRKPRTPEKPTYVVGSAVGDKSEAHQKLWSALKEKYRSELIERELKLKQKYGLDEAVTTEDELNRP